MPTYSSIDPTEKHLKQIFWIRFQQLSGLSFEERFLYSSILAVNKKFGQAATLKQLANLTGFDRYRTLPKLLDSLLCNELITIENSAATACKPPSGIAYWRKSESNNWQECLQYDVIALPEKLNRETRFDAVLLAVLKSLQKGKDLLSSQCFEGFAKLLGASKNRVKRARQRLEAEQKLIFVKSNYHRFQVKIFNNDQPTKVAANKMENQAPTTEQLFQEEQRRWKERLLRERQQSEQEIRNRPKVETAQTSEKRALQEDDIDLEVMFPELY